MSRTTEIIQAIYADEINASISWFWDGGFDVRLGDDMNGYLVEDYHSDSYEEAVELLRKLVCEHYPNSDFAKKFA